MEPDDQYGDAKMLIKNHGKDAKEYAMQHALERRAAGDAQGERTWLGVFEAILELQSLIGVEGQVRH